MLNADRFNIEPKVVKKKGLNPLPSHSEKGVTRGRFPSWLHRQLPKGGTLAKTGKLLDDQSLNTVCEEAKCPNRFECYSNNTATFLVMGSECTRACGFCDIDFAAQPKPLDPDEPRRVAESSKALGLEHVVITMVARDDLPDGGAQHLVLVMRAVRELIPGVSIEVLTSDFAGNEAAYDLIIKEAPDIFNYNIETVRDLSPRVRHKATYDRTLSLLQYVNDNSAGILLKSGIMLGLGENDAQVKTTIHDLYNVGCDVITMGQYLQPNRHKLRVKSFVPPEQFQAYAEYGYSVGLKHMYCGPFVRSSYNAGEVKDLAKQKLLLSQKN